MINSKADKKTVHSILKTVTESTLYECESTSFKMFESNLHGRMTISEVAD